MRAVCVFQQRLSPVTFCTREPTSNRRMTPTRGLLFRERTPRRFPVSLFPLLPSLPPSTFQGLCFMGQNSPLFNLTPPPTPPFFFLLCKISHKCKKKEKRDYYHNNFGNSFLKFLVFIFYFLIF